MLRTCIIIVMTSISLLANLNDTHRTDDHAPIGVMTDHKHHQNEVMISYRVMPMTMNSLIDGTNKVSLDTVQSSYMMSPKDMQMTMHMMGAMWGYSDHITLTAMMGFSDKKMTMINQMNQTSEMTSSGLNDIKLGAIFNLDERKSSKTIGNIGISLPIGSIKEKNNDGAHLPYGMQLGSGTYDLNLGLTHTIFFTDMSIGGQVSGRIRSGRNALNYRLGNNYQGTAWIQKLWANNVSSSLRITATGTTDITGKDNTLSAMQAAMSPMYNTNQGALVTDIGIGINYRPTFIKNTRIAGELSTPISQNTNTLTLRTDTAFTLGIQHNL